MASLVFSTVPAPTTLTFEVRVASPLRLEVFPGRHHFDPPHRVEPDRVAASLAALWASSHDGANLR